MISRKEMLCYETDASGLRGFAEKVLFPKNVKQVLEIMKAPAADIVPRGAGSGLVGGAVPNNSVVVDICKMNKVLEFNSAKRIVRVEAGITLRELNEKLAAKGFEFPIDVSNGGISTIGGMIATNASGDRSMKYGTMRDWIDEVEFVNGAGELIKTKKSDLNEICGMEGITGIIVSARLKLIPLIQRSASIFQTDSLDNLLSIARRLKSEKEVVKLKFFSKYVSRLLGLPEKYNLIIEFDSKRGKIYGEEYEKLLELEERVYSKLALKDYIYREDPKFFFDKIKEFLLLLELMNIPYFGHLGAGIIHPFFKKEEKTKREKIYELIKRSQGKLGKYGIGLARKDFLDSSEITLFQRVKSRHDPHGRMNRGKVIDSGSVKIKKTPSLLEKIREIKPGLGEEKSAVEVLKEMETQKSPEEKLNEFIQEVSVEEKIIKEVNLEPEKIEGREKTEIKSEQEEIKDRLKDYEQTYESELPNERRKIVEDFAKQVPKDLSKKPNFCSSSPNSLQKEFDDIVKSEIIHEAPKPRPVPKPAVDYKLISNIMNNRHSSNKGMIVEEKIVDVDDNNKLNNANNLNKPRTLTSDEDRDAINRIMTNRFGKGFVNNKDNKDNNRNKKEEK